MLIYLMKFTACTAIFWLVYKAFFEREKMHRFNRYYLLAGIAASVIIPLLSFTVKSHLFPPLIEMIFREPVTADIAATDTLTPGNITDTSLKMNHTGYILGCIYTIISVALLIRFIYKIRSVRTNISRGEVNEFNGAKLVSVDSDIAPHTFMNHIFIPSDKPIEEEILLHELTHARQRHSIDILIFELCNIIFWFNPVLLLYRRSAMLNHEYLADEATLSQCDNLVRYQTILIRNSDKTGRFGIASNFSFITTKKRLIMMTKQTSRCKALVKQSVIVPICVLALALFSNKVVAAVESPVTDSEEPLIEQAEQPTTGATKEQMEEYAKLAAKGTSRAEVDGQYLVIVHIGAYTDEDNKRMDELKKLMTPEQRKEQYFLLKKAR